MLRAQVQRSCQAQVILPDKRNEILKFKGKEKKKPNNKLVEDYREYLEDQDYKLSRLQDPYLSVNMSLDVIFRISGFNFWIFVALDDLRRGVVSEHPPTVRFVDR